MMHFTKVAAVFLAVFVTVHCQNASDVTAAPTTNVTDPAPAPAPAPSEDVTDVTGGTTTAKTVTGAFSIPVSDQAAFTSGDLLPTLKVALASAIAKTLAGVEAAWVTVTGITVVARRLEAIVDEDRRLAAGSVKVAYKIDLPKTYSGATITKASFGAASVLQGKIDAEIVTFAAANAAFTATVTGVPVIEDPVTVAVAETTANATTTAAASALVSAVASTGPSMALMMMMMIPAAAAMPAVM